MAGAARARTALLLAGAAAAALAAAPAAAQDCGAPLVDPAAGQARDVVFDFEAGLLHGAGFEVLSHGPYSERAFGERATPTWAAHDGLCVPGGCTEDVRDVGPCEGTAYFASEEEGAACAPLSGGFSLGSASPWHARAAAHAPLVARSDPFVLGPGPVTFLAAGGCSPRELDADAVASLGGDAPAAVHAVAVVRACDGQPVAAAGVGSGPTSESYEIPAEALEAAVGFEVYLLAVDAASGEDCGEEPAWFQVDDVTAPVLDSDGLLGHYTREECAQALLEARRGCGQPDETQILEEGFDTGVLAPFWGVVQQGPYSNVSFGRQRESTMDVTDQACVWGGCTLPELTCDEFATSYAPCRYGPRNDHNSAQFGTNPDWPEPTQCADPACPNTTCHDDCVPHSGRYSLSSSVPWWTRDNPHAPLVVESSPFILGEGPLVFWGFGADSADIPVGVTLDLQNVNETVGEVQGVVVRSLADSTVLAAMPMKVTSPELDALPGGYRSADWGWRKYEIPAEALAEAVGTEVVVDIIDSRGGGWGWFQIDTFEIPALDYFPYAQCLSALAELQGCDADK